MKQHKGRRFKQGAASFYMVAIATLVLVIIATSFAAIMIAEINNKMTIGEDELTGNFFGTLRYVRFEDVLLPVLLDTSHCENDFRDKSEFARI